MHDFPVSHAEFTLHGPAGRLQGIADFPAAHDAFTPVAIICHPHPPDGGSMHNKVVSTLAKAFTDSGYIALRFNFRGVGSSEGSYDSGQGELQDALAVCAWTKQARPQARLSLAGFSFGAWVALRAAEQCPPAVMVSIAPPVGFRSFDDVQHPLCPWLAIQGEADEVVSTETVLAWLRMQSPPPKIIVMPETGHFFHRKLLPLREQITGYLQGQQA